MSAIDTSTGNVTTIVGALNGMARTRVLAVDECILRNASAVLLALSAEIARKDAALRWIAAPQDCGCVPCRGQCRSEIALQADIDGRSEVAEAALAKEPGA